MAKHTSGPWAVGHRGTSIVCQNEKIGGEAKLFDVRGWGYLTGTGHGGLGLDEASATRIQLANAHLAAAAPDLLAALKAFPGFTDDATIGDAWIEKMRAAVYKAEGRS